MPNTNTTRPAEKVTRLRPIGARWGSDRRSVGDELSDHPLVVAAFEQAERLLTNARAAGTQKVAEAFAAAVRDRHNRALRTAR